MRKMGWFDNLIESIVSMFTDFTTACVAERKKDPEKIKDVPNEQAPPKEDPASVNDEAASKAVAEEKALKAAEEEKASLERKASTASNTQRLPQLCLRPVKGLQPPGFESC